MFTAAELQCVSQDCFQPIKVQGVAFTMYMYTVHFGAPDQAGSPTHTCWFGNDCGG